MVVVVTVVASLPLSVTVVVLVVAIFESGPVFTGPDEGMRCVCVCVCGGGSID